MEVYIMEHINYNGVDGVFIPNNEFEYIKSTVKANKLLLTGLIEELAKDNPNTFGYLLNEL